jgi:DNA repair protein RecO (recombination protein O)|tara:strand:- start:1199 stop:1909 length:711 start_codon:yes stop_codon:yes gene_type:complete
MEIKDSGFFLGVRKYGENSYIVFLLSKNNGLIKSFTKASKKQLQYFMILDEINFIWKAKHKNNLGFIKINHEKPSGRHNDNFLISLVKASASELCLNFLPLWQKNEEIYDDLKKLLFFSNNNENNILLNYIWWEIYFLKNTGYGLNINRCVVTGSTKDLFYISPNSGNSVSYQVGKKYNNKLFKIPKCLKSKKIPTNFADYSEAFKITTYFFEKNFGYNLKKFIFRTQLIKKIQTL